MLVRILLLPLSLLLLQACSQHDPRAFMGEVEYQQLVQTLTPYVHKKPEGIAYNERFSDRLKPYYARLQAATEGQLRFYKQQDSLHYFYYVRRDPSSLFEHYLGFGGVFTKNSLGQITFLELFFQTPRLSWQQADQRGRLLFEELLQKGHAKAYVGNRDYIKTPNADFYYNSRENRWDYTENSSWKFIQEARLEARQEDQPEVPLDAQPEADPITAL
ncbi:hypothetical protein [Cesiribacter andamanensis]|uniref:Lipoprotein n=1 Tax=Cesiribacter andamanensis AMV16 TaxID=1279009 RepID=M7N8P3_9BACT|nr:hypothetical protein [Cesiribacter andamanensis]EMR03632.1 hypothetical protein ADICEAN_01229 [Cesiribacter andamanensis AMV16]